MIETQCHGSDFSIFYPFFFLSPNYRNSGIVLRKVGILTLCTIPELYRYNSRIAQGILAVYRIGKSLCAKWESLGQSGNRLFHLIRVTGD